MANIEMMDLYCSTTYLLNEARKLKAINKAATDDLWELVFALGGRLAQLEERTAMIEGKVDRIEGVESCQ